MPKQQNRRTKLSELEFPIAIIRPDSVVGGKSANLTSYRRFRTMLADYFLEGGWNGALIVDADGGMHKVSSVTLAPLHWLDAIASALRFRNGAKELCRVDAELERIDRLDLEGFIALVMPRILGNKNWWDDYEWVSGKGWEPVGTVEDVTEIESMRSAVAQKFEGIMTLRNAISELGVWDDPSKKPRKEMPDVPINDLRD